MMDKVYFLWSLIIGPKKCVWKSYHPDDFKSEILINLLWHCMKTFCQSNLSVQGVKCLDATYLDLAFSKANMICTTDRLKFIWSYLTLIFKTEILYLTPLSLIDLFLFITFLGQSVTELCYERDDELQAYSLP